MKYFLVALFFALAPVAHAYNPILIESELPFGEIVVAGDAEGLNQSYLGTLEGYPEMYEFTLEEDATIQIQIKQRAQKDAQQFNLILVSVHPDTERIKEIVRVNTPIEEREEEFIWSLGITQVKSEFQELDLEAGRYRVEVSSALNKGEYELDFGIEDNDNSYLGTFAAIWKVQRHFEYWIPRLFLSSFVLYQVGIIILIGGFFYTWRKRKDITNAS